MVSLEMDLFNHNYNKSKGKKAPLAARMRPTNFNDFVGQEHLVGENRALRKAIESGKPPSVILWGPPGSGKTTLAFIIANTTDSHFSTVSAVSAGVADLRQIIEEARERHKLYARSTILFIDEIHRFNKAQQDVVLPYVEDGTITLVGATTENPSFEVITPLLSRCQVFVLKMLNMSEINEIVRRAITDEQRGLGSYNVKLDDKALEYLAIMSNGDARIALNILEMAALTTSPNNKGERSIDLATIEDAAQKKALPYDKMGEQHYDIISALHKTMRGSDPDASLYWLGRMLEAGEDPLYIARRLMRFASEDVGMADPQALVVSVAAQQAVHFIGIPEGNLALAQAVVYLATAPKSNTLYTAYNQVKKEIENSPPFPVPLHLRNPVTSLKKNIGYGKDYKYAHQFPGHFVRQQNLPKELQGKIFYKPSDQGFEKEIKERLKKWWQGDK